ncbi:MAG: HD domain-containing phosphohydrolase [Trueperaceae bacterium]
MSRPLGPEPFEQLRRQRGRMVQALLWLLLAVVVGAFALNAALLGREILTAQALVPNLAFALLLLLGLWLNGAGRFRVAVGIIVAVTLVAGVLGVLLEGLAAGTTSLLILFLPLVLAGLLLGRAALVACAGLTLAAVALAPLLHGSAPLAGSADPSASPWVLVLQFTIVYGAVAFLLDRFGLVFYSAMHTASAQEALIHDQAQQRQRDHEALDEGHRLNDAIVANLPGVFFMMDKRGQFYRLNRNIANNLGYSFEQLQGAGFDALVPPAELNSVKERIREVFEHGYAADLVTLIAEDGRRIPYYVRGTRVTLKGEEFMVGLGIDRSEIDEAQARVRVLDNELEERLERITALREIDRSMAGSLDLSETLSVVLQQVMQRLQVDAASILLYRSGSDTLRYGASRGFKGLALTRTELRMGQGLAGQAALTRETFTLAGRQEFARAFAGASSLQDEAFEYYMAVPLVSRGYLQGVLELFNYTELSPSDDWSDFLAALSTQAAIAISAARAFDNLERTNEELLLAYETTIEGWARALDLKDEDTEGHSRRVTELTTRLARRMGMTEEEIVHVRRGALLHDIGKMGIPDEILRKPGALTAEEWELMKKHTEFAREFLEPIPFLAPAMPIPYSHHEKFDGSGYPEGLAGEAIPLEARLFAVVDVYDALTSDRPYRAAWSEEQALEHIAQGAGSHFDPEVVEEFLALVRSSARRSKADTTRW